MGFIHGHEIDPERFEETPESGHRQSLGSHVQDLERASAGLVLNPAELTAGEGAVDETRGDAVCPQGVHLVLHEGDQRRNDQSQAVESQRGQLVAQGLAPARGHEHQRVPAIQNTGDDLLLEREEIVESEVCLEKVAH